MQTDKLLKTLGQDTIDEMDTLDEAELKDIIFQANSAMKQAKDELEANEKYQDLKIRLADVTAAKKEVDKRQKARIAYGLKRLEEAGKLDKYEREIWNMESGSRKAKLKEARSKKDKE